MNMKTIILGLFALILTLGAASFVAANPYSYESARDDPYSAYNMQYDQVGKYYQQTRSVYYNYESTYAYDYIAPPRAGGWFGSGTEWIVGLRSPQYTMIPPVHYTNYYRPACGWECWTGGWGYPRSRASEFPYRTRVGGIFSY